jgi:hypothetical protein
MSDLFWAAIGLVLIMEGILPFLIPAKIKELWQEMSKIPTNTLRTIGFGSMIVGVLILLITKT